MLSHTADQVVRVQIFSIQMTQRPSSRQKLSEIRKNQLTRRLLGQPMTITKTTIIMSRAHGQGNRSRVEHFHRVSTVCSVELKTKTSYNIAAILVATWHSVCNGQRFFRLGPTDQLVQSLSIPKDHVTQCMHQASVFGVRHFLYVVGTV